MNPFLQEKLVKLNNSKISFPEKSIEALKGMEIKGEEDVVAYITDRLLSGKVSICETIKNNDYDLWNESPSKKDNIPYIPNKSVLNKMKSACEYRPTMALELFEGEIMNIPQSLTPDGSSLYHGTKSDIAKGVTNNCGNTGPEKLIFRSKKSCPPRIKRRSKKLAAPYVPRMKKLPAP